MNNSHICVAIYLTHTQAGEALSRLQFAGFGTKNLSFAGRDSWENAVGSYATREKSQYCGPLGRFWERLWSILLTRGIFCASKDGPMLLAGPLVQTILAAQQQKSVNGNGFEVGLSTLGIPEKSIDIYTKALKNDQILLFVFGALDEVSRARDILNDTKAINHTLHHGAGDHLSLKITTDTRTPPKRNGRK